MEIIICNNAEGLRKALSKHIFTATVEAEYGDETVKGTLVTLAHHGKNSENPAPCQMYPIHNADGDFNNRCSTSNIGAIGLSHFDLDTLGGIRAILGYKWGYGTRRFWDVVADIDINGLHSIDKDILEEQIYKETGSTTTTIEDALNAYYAYSIDHKIYAPQNGNPEIINNQVEDYFDFLSGIFYHSSNPNYSNRSRLMYRDLIDRGRKFKEMIEEIKKTSLIEVKKDVAFRSHSSFVNNFYDADTSIIVGYKDQLGSITLSTKLEDFNCEATMKEVFGPRAGGRPNIAGTPREEKFSIEDAKKLFEFILQKR